MRITANQVTMARIFLLPVPVYMLLYGDSLQWWLAYALLIILGATDFIDGLMARREGPTRFGSLIDPVADKIFIAAIFLTMIAIGVFPPWTISVVISRELLVTNLRSSVAIRKKEIKTSTLAKMKTIIQMGGCGTIFLTITLASNILLIVFATLALIFLAIFLYYYSRKIKSPFWVLPTFIAIALVTICEAAFGKQVNLHLQMLIILSLTWISAIDYLVGSYHIFRKTGLILGDLTRIVWSIIFSIFVAPLVAYFPLMVLPILVSMSLEFGLGGIDNIVAAEKGHFSSWPFVLASLSGIIFAILVNACMFLKMPIMPFYFSIALAGISAIICGIMFGRYYELFRRTK